MSKLDKIYNKSKKISISNKDKIVIMSDCHRGIGDKYDNFYKNRNIYEYALEYYFNKGYTYIELGDGDELWEVKNIENIIKFNISSFKIIKKFYDLNRFYMIYGNHDIIKRNKSILKKYYYKYYDSIYDKYELLLNNLEVYESLILDYNRYYIFLLHGHQMDFFNSNLLILSKFLVKGVWKKLEYFGIDNTGDAKKYKSYKNIDKKLSNWSISNNIVVIIGHTHKSFYPIVGKDLYFNTGSCVHQDGIMCIEIDDGLIRLVKWKYDNNKFFGVKRFILDSSNLVNFYN